MEVDPHFQVFPSTVGASSSPPWLSCFRPAPASPFSKLCTLAPPSRSLPFLPLQRICASSHHTPTIAHSALRTFLGRKRWPLACFHDTILCEGGEKYTMDKKSVTRNVSRATCVARSAPAHVLDQCHILLLEAIS